MMADHLPDAASAMPGGARSSFSPVRLEDREFEVLRRLIHVETGISLAPSKRVLLESRLARRLRALELDSFEAYCDHLATRLDEELVPLINCVTTNKTEFFREAHHFEFLRTHVLPAAEARAERTGRRRLRIWSAGCSTGEEPYSLALTLLEWLEDRPGWDVRILASDIDTNVLDAAARGQYPAERLEEVPSLWRRRWFRERPDRPGWLQADEALRARIAFRRINLNEEPWAIRTTFDVILCRNVIIYFNRATQTSLLGRFARLLEPDGHLIIGHSESLAWLCDTFTAVRGQPTVYRLTSSVKRDAAAPGKEPPHPLPPLSWERGNAPSSGFMPARGTASDAAGQPARGADSHARRDASGTTAAPWPHDPPVREVGLGDVRASASPVVMHTLLGSCVAVALFDPEARAGGLNHFLLPEAPPADAVEPSTRYGDRAMAALLDALLQAGGERARLRAKLFGGASLGAGEIAETIAARNIACARGFLEREGIPIVAERVGGEAPIELLFHADSGRARVRELPVPERGAVADRERSHLASLRHAVDAEAVAARDHAAEDHSTQTDSTQDHLARRHAAPGHSARTPSAQDDLTQDPSVQSDAILVVDGTSAEA
jgi:chemotaxis protein methyltransferase CheR